MGNSMVPLVFLTLSFVMNILLDLLTCMQHSVMNFGILMIQGLVNSFGAVVMVSFAAAVKIDTLAYMPAQEFGNAYALSISQNFGARKEERINPMQLTDKLNEDIIDLIKRNRLI